MAEVMQLADVTRRELTEILASDDDIDCECMLCHLPLAQSTDRSSGG